MSDSKKPDLRGRIRAVLDDAAPQEAVMALILEASSLARAHDLDMIGKRTGRLRAGYRWSLMRGGVALLIGPHGVVVGGVQRIKGRDYQPVPGGHITSLGLAKRSVEHLTGAMREAPRSPW